MFILSNEYLQAQFDGQARLVSLCNAADGGHNVIEKPGGTSFLLNYRQGDCWENIITSGEQTFTVRQEGQSLLFLCETLIGCGGKVAVGLTLRVTLDGQYLRFEAEIDNRDDVTVVDFEYPCVGVIKNLAGGKPGLLWPFQAGSYYGNVGEYLSAMGPSREASANALRTGYPGGNGSMQWMALVERGQTLYLSAHDPEFYAAQMRVQGSLTDRGAITMVLGRMPFINARETWSCAPCVLSLYTGSWRRGADEYRAWAKTWRKPVQPAQWVRNMIGYFLVINKQQYGQEMWSYDRLPGLYELAKEHGCDTLGLFGWYDSGHDNQYPDLKCSDSMGGAETLRKNIGKVQAQGGHVTLYQQGHLIDVTTQYYKEHGAQVESRDRFGIPYYETYKKSHRSAFLYYFSNKTFSNACPSSEAWQELMEEKIDFVTPFGSDGVLFDQIGGMPAYPCFNEGHPHLHGKPSLSFSQGRRRLLARIHRHCREKNPEFAFFTEHITDAYSDQVDCLHGLYLYPWETGGRERAALHEGAAVHIPYPELFRYCFPETIITVRNPRPYIDRRMANFALVYGLVYEMELRYQADCDDILADKWPVERSYAKALSSLRRDCWDLIAPAGFADSEEIESVHPAVVAKSFRKGEHLAVALWNDSACPVAPSLEVAKGWQPVDIYTVEGEEAGTILAPQQVAIYVYGR